MHDGDEAAGLLRRPYLKFDPVMNVADRRLQPWFHVRDLQQCRDVSTIRREYCWMLADKTKPAQPLRAAPVERASPNSVNEAGAGRLFKCCGERAVFLAVDAGQSRDPAQMILRLIAVTLFDLPQSVILPGLDVVGIGFERALVPHWRELVVAELAIGVADQIGDRGDVVVTERLELLDRRGIVVAVIDRGVGRAITFGECRILDAGAQFAGLLFCLGLGRGGWRRIVVP